MERNRIVIFAFRGDPMCFIHVLLNGIDLHERGLGEGIIVEGDAVKLIPEIAGETHVLHSLYGKARELGVIKGVCKACSNKLGVAGRIEALGIELLGDMKGHPSMGEYIAKGFEIITF